MITIKGLSKIFHTKDQDVRAVDDLSLEINKGEIYGVIGYSGAGKSTFIRLLNRLEDPTEGSIWVDDQNLTSMNKGKLRLARQEIGMIFQHFNLLWSRTVHDNIAFPLEIAGVPRAERQKRVNDLIELVGLKGRGGSYPSQLSGGQKQRVGIARALANNPKVLLCDEATSALDPETTDSILDLLVDINEKLGLTIVLITHEMHVIRKICHQVAVMEQGKIVEQGEVLDVFLHPQRQVTKKFVDQVMGDPEKETSMQVIKNNYEAGEIIRLHFVGESTNQALISEISRKFTVDVNILHGKITQTQKGAYGTMYVQFEGEQDEINRAIHYIQSTSVEVEVDPDA
ncbi:D-methionine transport system ATP-binding protein [Halobacillus karajensis]|uniref:Methionine import ATP-binding protein MetN n=1 Tax=Halobacillus karajensis TaxID=195088 RepID=A0A024P3N9_9BACI|nr:methionine ABC transporter ATP-binding protein [Halobacillus karajensis]CDQ19326.1 Methionine import ATP-binding protein MetN [Halobacillus karajensis]CDQ22511.1 Methionine import ATP-binding protein MetN [Halobacillus karajensis]CDQ25993.1 Methionine import ATP-binding protein MetN [Halobacillus karajensis]SEH38285.1 D-methionine transport system ATP-binding protein [Halobacillus karajensis]